MFFRRQCPPQVHRTQRGAANRLSIDNTAERQRVLGLVVRAVLLSAGRQEAIYGSRNDTSDSFGMVAVLQHGFVIEAPYWAHHDTSIGVIYTAPAYDQVTAQRDADLILQAFGRIIGKQRAGRLVRQTYHRLNCGNDGYYDVTIDIPDDKTLRALYRKLHGRR